MLRYPGPPGIAARLRSASVPGDLPLIAWPPRMQSVLARRRAPGSGAICTGSHRSASRAKEGGSVLCRPLRNLGADQRRSLLGWGILTWHRGGIGGRQGNLRGLAGAAGARRSIHRAPPPVSLRIVLIRVKSLPRSPTSENGWEVRRYASAPPGKRACRTRRVIAPCRAGERAC
jgi:hypothetical protein